VGADLQDRRVRPSEHWSMGPYVSISRNSPLSAGKGRRFAKWSRQDRGVVVSTESVVNRLSSPGKLCLSTSERVGSCSKFIRLSRIWSRTEDCPRRIRGLVNRCFRTPRSEPSASRIASAMAQFLKVVENIKSNSFVHALQIESFQLTPQ